MLDAQERLYGAAKAARLGSLVVVAVVVVVCAQFWKKFVRLHEDNFCPRPQVVHNSVKLT